jgi:hypothetical protein
MSAVSADKLMWLAWDLQARLPGTGALLAAGDLTYAKAKVVYEALLLLSDQDAAAAEAMILPDLPGKTYGQVKKLAMQAAVTVDPASATRRRQDAEQNKSRVEMFREDSGAAALSGRDLPTDQALAAHAHVCARAQEYKDSGAFPDDVRMDQFRVAAYLDLLNGTPAEVRIAAADLDTCESDTADPDPAASSGAHDLDDDNPDDGEPGGGPSSGPGSTGSGGGSGGSGGSERKGQQAPELPPRLTDLVLPLATLLGLAERPGESHGLGTLDPELCRELAIAATGSPWTRLCVTVTDPDGIAIGHGCARPVRRTSGSGAHSGTGPAFAGEPDAHRNAPGGTRRRQTTRNRRPARPARTARPGALVVHPHRHLRATRRLRHLDPHPARRQEPHRGTRTHANLRMRSSARVPRLSTERHLAPPGPGPRLQLHVPTLLKSRQGQRLRARPALRQGRPHLRL